MAQACISKAVMFFFVVVLAVVASVSAQAQAPAPSMDPGAASSMPVSGSILAFSLVISLLALLKQ
ncbi:hypothetical protein SLEP1_g35157 [Rubroshorea leprosula]|uniref:Uncharacterized protein n=1 Tax=Rubroshorea leprosula TaxID=152421 RepID=A0AAV5KMS5_9ROSI|nr:hypothetical protein SLEP1_g35157 [Rubroshorea leprosula]